MIIAVGAIVAGVAIANNGNNDNPGPGPEPVPPKDFTPDQIMEGAVLKVMGNANKDSVIDNKDVEVIEKMIADKTSYNDLPIADANNDKVIDQTDVDIVKKIINKESTTVIHLNYYDDDGDGAMSTQLKATKYPITSCIITGSANTSMTLILLGIIDPVKGASYSSTSLDKTLYATTYLDTTKVVKLGTSAQTITFEDGKAGGSDVIKEKNVTALITDWNRTYITNWEDFENAGVDVIRGAAASTDVVVVSNTLRTYGLLFNVDQSRINNLTKLFSDTLSYVKEQAAKVSSPTKAVSSSMKNYVSSENSDYTEMMVLAGGEYGLKGYDFGGATSIKVSEHQDIFNYDFTCVFHVRTSLGYTEQTQEAIEKDWKDKTEPFATWASTGGKEMYLVSGVVPVPIRSALMGYAMEPGLFDIDKINAFHQQFVSFFPIDVVVNLNNLVFLYSGN